MQKKKYAAAFTGFFERVYRQLFHKRNIIIVSEHRVKHVPVSGGVQCLLVLASVAAICWASYSTGSYYAAHTALEEQSLTLKSVVGNKVDSNFAVVASDDMKTPLASSKAALSAVGSTELFSRIAELENKLKASEESKKNFIEKIQQRTSQNIGSFETMIEQTGLDVETLKDQMSPSKPTAVKLSDKSAERQGGPFIPDDTLSLSKQETEVITKLDELSVLKQIVENLPVRRPIRDYQEMSTFGHRIDPFTGRLAFHAGIDLAGPAESNIYATADGNVTIAERQGAYGNMIEIDHGFSISTRYAHLSRILVEDGQRIKKGQIIGIQGSTGRSTGPHLHYEVRYKDTPLDPRNFLTAGRYVPQS